MNPTTPPTDLKEKILRLEKKQGEILMNILKPDTEDMTEAEKKKPKISDNPLTDPYTINQLEIIRLKAELKGFLLGQQSADDKWLKLIDELDNKFLLRNWTPEQLLSIQHFIEELKSLSQNITPQPEKPEKERRGE